MLLELEDTWVETLAKWQWTHPDPQATLLELNQFIQEKWISLKL